MNGRDAAAERVRAFIARNEGKVSDQYLRGLRAALIVVEHVDFDGKALPDEG